MSVGEGVGVDVGVGGFVGQKSDSSGCKSRRTSLLDKETVASGGVGGWNVSAVVGRVEYRG